jgi:hypothetical protein
LPVGVYENKQLIFVAKVKNGFVPRIRDEISQALKTLRASRCPFKNLSEKRAPQRKWSNAAGSNRSWFAKSHSSNGRMPDI